MRALTSEEMNFVSGGMVPVEGKNTKEKLNKYGLPVGYEPVGPNTGEIKMMRNTATGKVYMTDAWRSKVDNIHVDKIGVASDLVDIIASSAGGVAIGLFAAVLIPIDAVAKTEKEFHKQ